jgi:hypothetical protein
MARGEAGTNSYRITSDSYDATYYESETPLGWLWSEVGGHKWGYVVGTWVGTVYLQFPVDIPAGASIISANMKLWPVNSDPGDFNDVVVTEHLNEFTNSCGDLDIHTADPGVVTVEVKEAPQRWPDGYWEFDFTNFVLQQVNHPSYNPDTPTLLTVRLWGTGQHDYLSLKTGGHADNATQGPLLTVEWATGGRKHGLDGIADLSTIYKHGEPG